MSVLPEAVSAIACPSAIQSPLKYDMIIVLTRLSLHQLQRARHASGTLSSAASAITCPTAMQNYFSYNVTVGGATSCSTASTLDVCTKTSTLKFNGSNCTTSLGYSGRSTDKSVTWSSCATGATLRSKDLLTSDKKVK